MHLSGFTPSFWRLALFSLSLFHYHTMTQITDFTAMSLYSSLPYCEKSVASSIYGYRASLYCSESDPEGLQWCICDYSSYSFSRMARSSLTSCSPSYSARMSVETVVEEYCSQTITTGSRSYDVNHLFTDLPQMTDLPPCAINALSSLFGSTHLIGSCPTNPASYANCLCSSRSSISSEISYSVSRSCNYWALGFRCASSAGSFWNSYCRGSPLPTTSPYSVTGRSRLGTESPISFSITDLVGYVSLGTCLTNPLSRVFATATNFCHTKDPAEFASCICLKSEVEASASSAIRSTATYSCTNKGKSSDRATSMLNVYSAYCSMARREVAVTPTSSGLRTYYRGQFEHDIEDDGSKSQRRKRIIIGAVVGGVLGASFIIGVILFFVLRKLAKERKHKAEAAAASAAGHGMNAYELGDEPGYGPGYGPQLPPQNGPRSGPQNVPRYDPQQLPPAYTPQITPAPPPVTTEQAPQYKVNA